MSLRAGYPPSTRIRFPWLFILLKFFELHFAGKDPMTSMIYSVIFIARPDAYPMGNKFPCQQTSKTAKLDPSMGFDKITRSRWEVILENKHTDAVMTIEELAEYLKISTSTLYKYAQQGRIPAVKLGKHWRFSKLAIDQFLENNPYASITKKR